MLKEFRQFIQRGNVLDLAVGIIIGAAFGSIVNSFVTDILMPPIGLLVGGIDFSSFELVLKQAQDGQQAVVIKYGKFLNHVISFLIVSWAVFILIKMMDIIKKKEESQPQTPPPPPADIVLLTEIRDLLKKQ